MTRDKLIERLKKYEWSDIEFKEAAWAAPRSSYETVSAFANTAGGWLVFGVRDHGGSFEVVGVIEVDKVQNEFLSTLRSGQKVSHTIDISEEVIETNGDTLLVFISFREATINVLLHQDYGDHGRWASIRLFRDGTVFYNPGDAFASTDELLDPTAKEVRNPSIVTAFRRIGLSEQAGTGVRTIFRNWQRLGHVPPVIDNDKEKKSFTSPPRARGAAG